MERRREEAQMRRQRAAVVMNNDEGQNALMPRVTVASRPPKDKHRKMSPCRRHNTVRLVIPLALVFILRLNNVNPWSELMKPEDMIGTSTTKHRAQMGSIVYGAKGKGEDTAKLVLQAIQSGFRHIATVRIIQTTNATTSLRFA
jgi:hypothetical protein